MVVRESTNDDETGGERLNCAMQSAHMKVRPKIMMVAKRLTVMKAAVKTYWIASKRLL